MRIAVDVPTDDVRRERVERATFARLDAIREALAVPDDPSRRDRIEHAVFQQVAEARGRERIDYALQPRRRWVPLAGFAVAAAAAVVLVIGLRAGDRQREPVVAHHVVPSGEHERWTFGDAVIDASGGTTVDERLDDTGVTLSLAHGKVDCEVEPRSGRTPFRVVAGDVTVTVVGTRFAVERTSTGVHVEVAHGKVRVTAGDKETLLTNGQAWSSNTITAGAAPVVPGAASSASAPPTDVQPIDQAEIDMEGATAPDLVPVKPAAKAPSPKELFDAGTALEQRRDYVRAAAMYRKAASTKDPKYAAVALYSLVDVERKRGAPTRALREIDEYLQRFPSGVAVEELLWLRVDIHRATGNTEQMNTAARAYLDRFPRGTYANLARKRVGE